VTAYRMVRRSPPGDSFHASTRLSLVGSGEVMWVRGRLYLEARVGSLYRLGWPELMSTTGRQFKGR
jgi:hypothetical protein